MAFRILLPAVMMLPPAVACSCGPRLPVCAQVSRADYLFLGRAVATNYLRDGNDGPVWYRFVVEEVFRGLPEGLRTVIVDPGNGVVCRRKFEVGTSYLVMGSQSRLGSMAAEAAHESGPVVWTSDCSGTLPASEAAEDLAFLRRYTAGQSETRLFGAVRMEGDDHRWDDELPGVAGAVVQVTGEGTERRLTAGPDGRFEWAGVKPGSYAVSVTAPGLAPVEGGSAIDVPAGGCGVVRLGMVAHGSMEGVVVRQDGSPVAKIEVEYRSVTPGAAQLGIPSRWVATNEKGEYRFTAVPPGEYVVGVHVMSAPRVSERIPPTFWPDAAEAAGARPVQVGLNERKQGLRIVVGPRMGVRVVKVRVRWSDGRPAAGAKVLAGVKGSLTESAEAGADGVAEIQLLYGVEYELRSYQTYNFRWLKNGGTRVDQAESAVVTLLAGQERAEVELVQR